MSITAKEQQILSAAERLFLRHGYEGATTNALAEAAGVSKETLYRYYPTKDDLLSAVIEAMAERRRALAADIVLPPRASRRTLEVLLRRFAEEGLAQTMRTESLDLLRLVVGESARRPHLAKPLREALTGGGAVRRLLEHAREQGLVHKDVDAEVAAQMLGGTLLGWVFQHGLLAGTRARTRAAIDIDEIVRLFLRAVGP